jgi:hypothetical protein
MIDSAPHFLIFYAVYSLIFQDNKYQMTNDGLMIRNAQPEDEGVYICQASVTSTGEVKRVDINVQVMCTYFLKYIKFKTVYYKFFIYYSGAKMGD